MCMCACNTEYCCSLPFINQPNERHKNDEEIPKCLSSSSDEQDSFSGLRPSSASSRGTASGPRWADMSDSEDEQDGEVASLVKTVQHAKSAEHHVRIEHAQAQPRTQGRGKAAPRLQPEAGDSSVTQTRVRNSRHKGGARNKQQARGHDTKHQCQFFIGIEEEPKFRVVRRIIGTAGANVKYIAEQSGPDTKLRLRGRGSKFLEGPDKQEAPEPLMLCVSVPNRAAYDVVTRLVREQLERVYDEYDNFRVSNGQSALRLRVRMHEGPRAGSR